MRQRVLVACFVLAVRSSAPRLAQADAPAPVSFAKDVAPILVKHCQACHGAEEPKGGYQIVNLRAGR